MYQPFLKERNAICNTIASDIDDLVIEYIKSCGNGVISYDAADEGYKRGVLIAVFANQVKQIIAERI